MRGIITAAGYVPYHRLDRAAIGAAHGGSGGKGTRSVASYDEDTTTMGVEAARLALRSRRRRARVDQLWFSTTAPSYADKTNATVVHAALRLDRDIARLRRQRVGALGGGRAASRAHRRRIHPGGHRRPAHRAAEQRRRARRRRRRFRGADRRRTPPVRRCIAEYLGGASTSEEFVDRWRVPGDPRSRQWEERFGEMRYVPLGTEAFKLALDAAGVGAEDIASVIIAGTHTRAVRQVGGKVGAGTGGVADDLALTVGNAGAAQPLLQLAAALEAAEPGQVLALVVAVRRVRRVRLPRHRRHRRLAAAAHRRRADRGR